MRRTTCFLGNKVVYGVGEQTRLFRVHLLPYSFHALLRLVDPLVKVEKTVRQQFE